ncbi:MAG: NINE protein [Spirochaetota bacterium]
MKDKDLAIAYILAILGGPLALHRHYLGKHGSALLQLLLTFTGIGVLWWFIDLFMMPSMVREENFKLDSHRRPVNVYIDGERRYSSNDYDRLNEFKNRVNTKKPKTKEQIERDILNLAKKNNGRLTVTQVAMETDLSLEKAEEHLQNMVKSGYVQLSISDNGVMVYEFLEII